MLHLKEQTIFIRTRGKHGEDNSWNARDLAKRLATVTSPLDNKTQFNGSSGDWFEMGVLVVARPGSGKTWMVQQVAHYLCEEYIAGGSGSSRFVPVLFSIQRVARLCRSETEIGTEFTSETDAIRMLKLILRSEHDEETVSALLECYDARTLVILLDGIDEASSLARTFESLGRCLCKSGNRVMMASRQEGIQSERFYEMTDAWSLLDLPKLTLEQQSHIVTHQIGRMDSPFFKYFFEFQRCRESLDTAAHACDLKKSQLSSLLKTIEVSEPQAGALVVFNSNILKEVERAHFQENQMFESAQVTTVGNPLHKALLDELDGRYKNARAAKSNFDAMLDALALKLKLRHDQVVKTSLKTPKRLLQTAARDNGLGNVVDLVRASLVCDNNEQLIQLAKCIADDTAISVHAVHNGFQDLDFIHYGCLTFNILIEVALPDSGGCASGQHACELQMHLKQMYELEQSCESPRRFFVEQGGLAGNESERMQELKKRMDIVNSIGATPVLLSVFLICKLFRISPPVHAPICASSFFHICASSFACG